VRLKDTGSNPVAELTYFLGILLVPALVVDRDVDHDGLELSL